MSSSPNEALKRLPLERLEWLLTHPTTEWEIGEDVDLVRIAIEAQSASTPQPATQQSGGDPTGPKADHDRIAAICELDGCYALRSETAPSGTAKEINVGFLVRLFDDIQNNAAIGEPDWAGIAERIWEARKMLANGGSSKQEERK